jgi:hypothetical protein
MRLRLAGLVMAGVLAGSAGCNSASSRTDAAILTQDVGGRADDERDALAREWTSIVDVAVEAPADTSERDAPAADGPSSVDLAGDQPAGADRPAADQASSSADGGAADATADSAAGCATQMIVLARAGTTSSCSFKVPSSIPRDRVNLSYAGRRLCQQGSNNCTSRGGWFWFGDEVALCDATCLSWEDTGANLVLEAGCPSESCFVACRQEGGPCGDGVNSCCVGWRCSAGSCVACTRGGQACTATAECCAGTCQNGTCVGPLGSACVSQTGCAQGECRDGRCQCTVDQISCNTGCVSYTDPNNCRGCGNVCPAGRVCTVDGCVCDPKNGLPDDCNGQCVNRSNDRNNCGFCSFVCPRLDQVCAAGKCGCPTGQTDCNGSCVDTTTSPSHCGMCNHACVPGAEACSGGTCVCAPGMTRCSGTCVNLLTSKLNCGTCGNACPGNKTCTNGSCG